MGKKLIYSSNFDLKGSGYLNLSLPLMLGLVERGWDIKIAAVGGSYVENSYPFSLIPCRNFSEQRAVINNLCRVWTPDVLCISFDIPVHDATLGFLQKSNIAIPYVGIFAVESPPLALSWSMGLMKMKERLAISKFAAEECNKMNVPTGHLPIGVNTDLWAKPSKDLKNKLRKSMGISEDTFLVLTVADNQERKNLPGAFSMVSKFKERNPDKSIKYWLVTREHLPVGWLIRDLARMYNINNELAVFERGMDFEQLWSLYACADVFLLPSKAESLGMPILEAMSCGVPCVGTHVGGIVDHLSEGRGYLIPPQAQYVDVFGNGIRYFPDENVGCEVLEDVYAKRNSECQKEMIGLARQYVEDRKWENAVSILHNTLERALTNV